MSKSSIASCLCLFTLISASIHKRRRRLVALCVVTRVEESIVILDTFFGQGKCFDIQAHNEGAECWFEWVESSSLS
ncbi:uncharacterized protein [Nicotiana sylvestris]|uniref:uncharacterized protein isoform X4 n=1 Tax=Nicotiana sylvestris TaxID=4096 RepID=UPI00388C8B69